MKYSTLLISITVFLTVTHSLVIADEAKSEALAKALVGYQTTGVIKKCVRMSDIRNTKVIDDQNILFELRRGKAYLNKLPNRCPRLAAENRFSYKVTVGQLCSVDTITVLFSPPGVSGPTCGLGNFEVYEKIE